jgi:Xaa-Pro dipeptidase
MDLPSLQSFMLDRRIDAWVLWDFRGSNPVAPQLFPAPTGKRWTTRRFAIVIPARGEVTALVHTIDATQFDKDAFAKRVYLSWQDLRAGLSEMLSGCSRVAMEYSPGGQLPAVSFVDAGAVELVRSLGLEVVSSADLIQASVARWSEHAVRDHLHVSKLVADIKDNAFGMISNAIGAGGGVHITEQRVQEFILSEFARHGLQTDGEPVVAVNAHAGDPHFEVSHTGSSEIKRGDWVLIDLWARTPGEQHIFSDITWCGCVGPVNAERRKVYDSVRRARDAALALAQQAWSRGEPIQGWQLDDAARNELVNAGYQKYIRHRTGHSLSPGPKVHGVGMNLDNLETRDTRQMLPGIGYTIEPGLYLPDFGVRLEINVYVDPAKGPVVTSCFQDEPVALG